MVKLDFEQRARSMDLFHNMVDSDDLIEYSDEIIFLRDENERLEKERPIMLIPDSETLRLIEENHELKEKVKKCRCCCCPHGVDHGH